MGAAFPDDADGQVGIDLDDHLRLDCAVADLKTAPGAPPLPTGADVGLARFGAARQRTAEYIVPDFGVAVYHAGRVSK